MRTAVFFTQQKIRHLRLIKVNNLSIYFSDISGGLTASPIFVMRILLVSICSCFKMGTPLKSNMASWKITMFSLYLVTGLRLLPAASRVKTRRGTSHSNGYGLGTTHLETDQGDWIFPEQKKGGHFGGGTGSSMNLYVLLLLLLFCLLVVFLWQSTQLVFLYL